MILSIVIWTGLLLAIAISVGLVVRDVRRLHHSHRTLADRPGDAGGVTAAGMTFFDNSGSH